MSNENPTRCFANTEDGAITVEERWDGVFEFAWYTYSAIDATDARHVLRLPEDEAINLAQWIISRFDDEPVLDDE